MIKYLSNKLPALLLALFVYNHPVFTEEPEASSLQIDTNRIADSAKTMVRVQFNKMEEVRDRPINTVRDSVVNFDLGVTLGFLAFGPKSTLYIDPDDPNKTKVYNQANPFIEGTLVMYFTTHMVNWVTGVSLYSLLTNYNFQSGGLFQTQKNISLNFDMAEIPLLLRIDPWFWKKRIWRIYFEIGPSFTFVNKAEMAGSASDNMGEIVTEVADIQDEFKSFFVILKWGAGLRIAARPLQFSLGMRSATSIVSIVRENLPSTEVPVF